MATISQSKLKEMIRTIVKEEIAELRSDLRADLRADNKTADNRVMLQHAGEIARAIVPEISRSVETAVMKNVNGKIDATMKYIDHVTVDGDEYVTQYRRTLQTGKNKTLFFE